MHVLSVFIQKLIEVVSCHSEIDRSLKTFYALVSCHSEIDRS
jgi:hypothetical protein